MASRSCEFRRAIPLLLLRRLGSCAVVLLAGAAACAAPAQCKRAAGPVGEPFQDLTKQWHSRGVWPASWVDHPERPLGAPSVCEFRLEVEVAEETTSVLHVSADNRYRLFIDGEPVGRGPERGDTRNWRFESYELTLLPGRHAFLAQTWWLGQSAPWAQMSIRPGFLLAAEGPLQEILSTGRAKWEARMDPTWEFLPFDLTVCTGPRVKSDPGKQDSSAAKWKPVETIVPAMSAALKNEYPLTWLLTPATLPPMKEVRRAVGKVRWLADAAAPYPVRGDRHLAEEAAAWQRLFKGDAPLTVPAHTRRRAIVDLEDYYCGYPELRTSGGKNALVRVHWAEGLYEQDRLGPKGNRDVIEGKHFMGTGDVFMPDGGGNRAFTTLWWEAGRYLEVLVETADAPLTIQSFDLAETGYPLEHEQQFRCSDPRLERIVPVMTRTLQMCAHETYMDCPYYEQLMYVGDTRLEALVTHALTRDDRLPRKALSSFDASRLPGGFTQSRYPSRTTQIIPPFSLWYVCMAKDYAMWRDNPEFVRGLLPGVRQVMEAFRGCLRNDGVMNAPKGWNFVDWVPGWNDGMPPGAEFGPSAILNLQFVLALQSKAELEETFGDAALAARDRNTAADTFAATMKLFFVPGEGVLADDPEHKHFSEHAQCLAILSGLLSKDELTSVSGQLLTRADLSRTTIYFTHYLFETLGRLHRPDVILERLKLWFGLPEQGFRTTFEMPEPTRSDCHAWATHPLWHYHATLAGVRPAAPGFERVRIEPQLGPLEWVESVLPHPRGEIRTKLRRVGRGLEATVSLPREVTGTILWDGQEKPLSSGENTVKFQPETASH